MKFLTIGLLLASVLIAVAPEAAANHQCTTTEVVPGLVSQTECGDSQSSGTCADGSDGYDYSWSQNTYNVAGAASAQTYEYNYCYSSTSWDEYYTQSSSQVCAGATDVGNACASTYEYYSDYSGNVYQDCYARVSHSTDASNGYNNVYPADEVCAL